MRRLAGMLSREAISEMRAKRGFSKETASHVMSSIKPRKGFTVSGAERKDRELGGTAVVGAVGLERADLRCALSGLGRLRKVSIPGSAH